MKKTGNQYKGIIVPMVTPFKEDLSIDIQAVKKILDTFLKTNISPFILGTTGESVSVSGKQKARLVKSVVEQVNKKVAVYAGISENCLQESVDRARMYYDMGIDAAVAHLPYYYPISPDQMISYYEKLADSIPCPLFLYNNPFTTKISIPLEIIDQLSYHSNIVGVKDSERDMERLDHSIMLWRYRSDFIFLAGWAEHSAYSLLNGAEGVVPSAGNLIPDYYRDLYEMTIKGKETEAYDLQDKINQISELCQKDKNISESIPILKTMMSAFDLCQPFVAPPMANLGTKVQIQVKAIIKAALTGNNNLIK
ncbi:MAG: dihydrodipicolinate synthase family protein [Bacteroidales bacterium]|nr:MAG: dihydrodipicolinate synthase family protein [Bacteroidales bacterium]